jgi:hypothetical protein
MMIKLLLQNQERIQLNDIIFYPWLIKLLLHLQRGLNNTKGSMKILFFTSKKLCSVDDKSLLSCFARLEAAIKSGEYSDIDGKELHMELKFLQDFIPKGDIRPLDILKFVKRMGCFTNTLVAYRIL